MKKCKIEFEIFSTLNIHRMSGSAFRTKWRSMYVPKIKAYNPLLQLKVRKMKRIVRMSKPEQTVIVYHTPVCPSIPAV